MLIKLKHLEEANETYVEHLIAALKISGFYSKWRHLALFTLSFLGGVKRALRAGWSNLCYLIHRK